MAHPLWILSVLCLTVAASEWLARHTWLRHLGSALLVIVLTAAVANLGVVPAFDDSIGVYNGVFEYVAPLAIFLLMLRVQLRGLLAVGAPMLALFLLGSLGTFAGVVAGMKLIGGASIFGEWHGPLAGMFVGTYTGGSVNFNAVALHYGVNDQPTLYTGAAAVDSAMTTVWMAATVFLPRVLSKGVPADTQRDTAAAGIDDDVERTGPTDLALLLGLAGLGVWSAAWIADGLSAALGLNVPSILVMTTLALILAQIPAVGRLRGIKLCGWLAVMIFLAVIGALCDLEALAGLGSIGVALGGFVVIAVTLHGLIVFVPARLLGMDPQMAAVASQANIGGGTSALALARSFGRGDLTLPAILVGSLGNALGTYLGFLAAGWLG
jgi:uncharacterized membrane protein